MKLRSVLLPAAVLLLAATPTDVPASRLHTEQAVADTAIAQGTATPTPPASTQDSEQEAVRLFVRALREVRDRYVDPMSDRELAELAVQAMVGRDRWSKYLNETQYKEMQASNRGSLVGIGIRYEIQDGRVRVLETFADGPAAKAGLVAGDELLSVDGKPLAGLGLDQVRELIKGEEGSPILVSVAGAAGQRDLRMERKGVVVPSIASAMVDGFGYVRVGKFDGQTMPGFRAALESLRKDRGVRGLVLDLRDNPGGLVDSSVQMADALLERGTIVSTRGREKGSNETLSARAGDDTGGMPIVVLVNSKTASAAEILAGALQDNRRATLIGSRTFGKGVIQSTRSIPGGGAIKITTARYATPAGHPVHEAGIAPDIVLGPPDAAPVPWGTKPDPSKDVQLAQALALLDKRPNS